MEPAHPTEQYIEGRLAFYESGAAFYSQHGQRKLAQWSRDEAEKWRQKLMRFVQSRVVPSVNKPTVRESGDGE